MIATSVEVQQLMILHGVIIGVLIGGLIGVALCIWDYFS